MHSTSNHNRASGWADDWTTALERNGRGEPVVPCSSREELLLPQLLAHCYCAAAESDEWTAVLGSREAQDAASLTSETISLPAATAIAWSAGDEGSATRGAPVALIAALSAGEGVTAAAQVAAAGAAATGPGDSGMASPQHPQAPQPSRLSQPSSCSGAGGDRVLFAAIELGSHCTRAVLHDGVSELLRLTYDTMLGQSAGPPGGGNLGAEALGRTLAALGCVMAAAKAAAAATHAGAGAGAAAAAAQAAAAAALPSENVAAKAEAPRPPSRSWSDAAADTRGAAGTVVARMVATAAVRTASEGSRAALAEAAERVGGAPLEVLGGEAEGRLAWRGVVGGLRSLEFRPVEAPASGAVGYGCPLSAAGPSPPWHAGTLLLVDMGGRSTEFAYGSGSAQLPAAAVSVPLGCVGLHSAALAASSVTILSCSRAGAAPAIPAGVSSLEGLVACEELAKETVQRLCGDQPWLAACGCEGLAAPSTAANAATHITTSHRQAEYPRTTAATSSPPHQLSLNEGSTSVDTVIFTGGTITTLAALHQQLTRYNRARVHGSVLTAGDMRALMHDLARADGLAAALRMYEWLTEARCLTLAAGCAGLLGVMAALRVERVVVSDADLLDGLLEELLEAGGPQPRPDGGAISEGSRTEVS